MPHDNVPCAVDVLFAVVRLLAGDALTPAVEAIAMQCDQQDTAVISAAKAGLEKMNQRDLQFAECDSFDLHNRLGDLGFWRVRQILVPVSELKTAVTCGITFIAEADQTTRECGLE